MSADPFGDEICGYSPFDGQALVGVLAFGEVVADPRRIVGRTRLTWKQKRFVVISTVGLPVLTETEPPFETMVFGDTNLLPRPMDAIEFSDIGGRYATREEALVGHRAWCRVVSGWLAHAGRHTVTWSEEPSW